jgi:phosphatidylserine decarboxylase
LSYRHGLFDTIADTLAPVHRDGHKFIAAALLVTLLLFLLWPPLGWVLALVTAWMIYFFRDPDRVVPMREGLVVSAADGRIAMIEKVRPPLELGLGEAERVRISTFLSVFDVHIQRAPVAGRIARSIYVPGVFVNAPRQGERGQRAPRHRHPDAGGRGDRGGADRRPRRPAHRDVRP